MILDPLILLCVMMFVHMTLTNKTKKNVIDF